MLLDYRHGRPQHAARADGGAAPVLQPSNVSAQDCKERGLAKRDATRVARQVVPSIAWASGRIYPFWTRRRAMLVVALRRLWRSSALTVGSSLRLRAGGVELDKLSGRMGNAFVRRPVSVDGSRVIREDARDAPAFRTLGEAASLCDDTRFAAFVDCTATALNHEYNCTIITPEWRVRPPSQSIPRC